MSKKRVFKQIIQEFIESELPPAYSREFGFELPLDSKKILVLYGPRRTGKTYIFYELISKLRKKYSSTQVLYINFEDDRLLPLQLAEFNELLEAYFELYPESKDKKIFLFFDEIQNIQGWEVFVRRINDRENAQIFITGSSAKLLSHEIASSLRGRSISYKIYPLSFSEYLNFKGIELKNNYQYSKQRFEIMKELENYLYEGAFPEVALNENRQLDREILQEYFNSLVYRDIVDRYSLRSTVLLKDLLKYLFTNSSKTFSVNGYYKAVKQNIPVSKDTIHEYLHYIEETGYFYLLPIFSYSLKEQRVNNKKIISIDNGLRNKVSFKFSSDAGRLAENLVGLELLRRYDEVFYWEKKYEVDFVVKSASQVFALNVCYSDEIPERKIQSLLAFKKAHKNVKKLVILTKDIEEELDGISFVPLWQWLL